MTHCTFLFFTRLTRAITSVTVVRVAEADLVGEFGVVMYILGVTGKGGTGDCLEGVFNVRSFFSGYLKQY